MTRTLIPPQPGDTAYGLGLPDGTDLPIGPITDGQVLTRSGGTVVGTALASLLTGTDWQSSVASATTTATPGAPSEGARYIVPAAGVSGSWVGHETEIAVYSGGWSYVAPEAGWTASADDTGRWYRWSGSAWVDIGTAVDHAATLNRGWTASGHTGTADRLAGFGGAGAAEEVPITAAGKSLLDDADATAMRSTLGLGSMALVASPAPLADGGAGISRAVTSQVVGAGDTLSSATGKILLSSASAVTASTTTTITAGAFDGQECEWRNGGGYAITVPIRGLGNARVGPWFEDVALYPGDVMRGVWSAATSQWLLSPPRPATTTDIIEDLLDATGGALTDISAGATFGAWTATVTGAPTITHARIATSGHPQVSFQGNGAQGTVLLYRALPWPVAPARLTGPIVLDVTRDLTGSGAANAWFADAAIWSDVSGAHSLTQRYDYNAGHRGLLRMGLAGTTTFNTESGITDPRKVVRTVASFSRTHATLDSDVASSGTVVGRQAQHLDGSSKPFPWAALGTAPLVMLQWASTTGYPAIVDDVSAFRVSA